ncbi:MAG: OmpA family protein [Bacteroidaceae bacterium]|nr:OmpA family protein [Bacteroidaceae bacterium]
MKKNLILLVALLMSCFVNVQAQDENLVKVVKQGTGDLDEVVVDYYDPSLVRTNAFHSNWEFSIGAGGSFYVGESDQEASMSDRWAFPAIDFSLYKWATPIFGLGITLNYTRYKSVYDIVTRPIETFSNSDDALYKGSLYTAWGNFANVFLIGTTDLCNLFAGYNGSRRFHLLFNYGAGFAITFGDAQMNKMSPSFNLGLMAQYQICDRWAINVNARGAFLGDSFDGQSWETDLLISKNLGREFSCGPDKTMDGYFGITAGISYKFGWKKSPTARAWIPMSEIVQDAANKTQAVNNVTIGKLNNELTNVAAAGLASGVNVAPLISNPVIIKDAEARSGSFAPVEGNVEYIKEINTNYRVLVNFVIDHWEISNREEIIVQNAAEFINSAPAGQKFDVIGYADVQTATPDHNVMLSRNRANNVAKMLVEKYKVDPNRLNITWVGGHDYLYFDDPQCTRSVIIRAVGSKNMVE